MTIHFRRASRSGGGAFIAKSYRGQYLLYCPAAFCNLHGTCRIFQSAWLFTSKLQGRCCHFHCNFTQCPPFSVKPQRQQNVSAQPFMLRKTKNQTINIIQILKNRIAVSLWKQRLAYYTLHLVQSPTSDIGRLTYVSQCNGYNHQSWVSSSFSYTAYSCWILFNATALSTEVHGLWYCWWALNLLRWAAFYGFLGMLKSNKWQTGEAIRKAHMFLINQQIDACLEGSLTPARVACQELLFNIFFFFNTWSKKVQPSKLCLLSRIGSCYDMQCFLDILANFFSGL